MNIATTPQYYRATSNIHIEVTLIDLLIVTLIYLLCVWGSYRYIQKAHYHKEGRWKNISTTTSDTVRIFLPFVNGVDTLMYILGSWKSDYYRRTNFFKPKK